MKKVGLLLLCGLSLSLQAKEETKVWYEYKQVLLPNAKLTILDSKLKLLELVSLRQWRITEQTLDSFSMTLKSCNMKIIFNEEAVIINHDKFKILDQSSFGSSKSNIPACNSKWLSNIEKDINASLNILLIQQEAIYLDKLYRDKM